MLSQLDELIIRQRATELNKRLDRLYVPADLGKETNSARLSLAALRSWLMHVGAVLRQHGRNSSHGAAPMPR